MTAVVVRPSPLRLLLPRRRTARRLAAYAWCVVAGAVTVAAGFLGGLDWSDAFMLGLLLAYAAGQFPTRLR